MKVFLGYDPREAEAFAVARSSITRQTPGVDVRALHLPTLRERGYYKRPTSRRDGQLWDDISDAPMSTEFAISRFLTKELAGSGWAVFMDCDVLVRMDLRFLLVSAESQYAVMCVKHKHEPIEATKMDGQLQTLYARKNWSSVMLFNCDHPANRALTVEMINTLPGRDLHRFCWLRDEEIGALYMGWNHLVGTSNPDIEPHLVHFTAGGPWLPGYEDVPFADEWRAERARWLNKEAA